MSTATTNEERDEREDVPGGRCYWCASQEHDSDHCEGARLVFDELAARYRREQEQTGGGG